MASISPPEQVDASVEAEAAHVLNDLKDGKISIGQILGPLYVSSKTDMNPVINIPPGGKDQPFVAPNVAMAPAEDPHVISTIGHVGPSPEQRSNPTPKADYDLVVIGAGVAGLLSVICAKALGKRAALIERHYMGGDCLNVGCFPSKAVIRCARAIHDVKNSAKFGVKLPEGEITIDFGFVMARMRELRASIAPHDGVDRYCRDFCDDIFIGDAKFSGPNTIQVEGMDAPLVFKKAMIATGASAAVPPIPGLREVPHLTNNNFFNLTELPPRLILIGAGPIGIELSQTMARFGSEVTVLEIGSHLLPREDPDAAEVLRSVLVEEMRIEYSVQIKNIEYTGGAEAATCAPWGVYKVTVVLHDGTETVIECDALLNATGRVPNVCNLNLEKVGVDYNNRNGIIIDETFKTANDNIYSCGDCASPFKFTHAADWQARTAIRNMFLGTSETQSQLLIPWCTYTEPEIAHVGLYEQEMDNRGINYTSYKRELKDVDRCKCEGVTEGFVKISAREGTDEILGATIVGPSAGDMISEITLCMNNGIGMSKLAGCVHPYPTSAEAVRQCAAQFWQRGGLKTPVNLKVIELLLNEKAAADASN
jgi:pyruvate/2-oxoglutarate dehydrogenase complex dihydrolipoamide dehydrogenase (E3) component